MSEYESEHVKFAIMNEKTMKLLPSSDKRGASWFETFEQAERFAALLPNHRAVIVPIFDYKETAA